MASLNISGAMENSSYTRTAVSPYQPDGKTASDISNSSLDAILPQALMIVFAMVILLVVIAVFITCFYKLRRDKKRRRNDTTAGAIASSHDGISRSPDYLFYFQQKPELDAERMRYEMEGIGRILELEGQDRFQELGGEDAGLDIPSLGILHELQGDDPAKELDVSPER